MLEKITLYDPLWWSEATEDRIVICELGENQKKILNEWQNIKITLEPIGEEEEFSGKSNRKEKEDEFMSIQGG